MSKKYPKSVERYFYAQDYERQIRAKLTKKQMLVYTYLMSLSKYDAQTQEDHYYVYKSEIVIKDATAKLKITSPTWRSAIEKLKKENLIGERDRWYELYFIEPYAPLDIRLIGYLMDFSLAFNNGGNLVGVYATICRYWQVCYENGKPCVLTINKLLKLFERDHTELSGKYYEILLALFGSQGLMSIKQTEQKYHNIPYTAYEITYVNTHLPQKLSEKGYGPSEIEDIVEALQNSFVK